MKQKKVKKVKKYNRNAGFRFLCKIMRIFIKPSTFEYLGEEIKPGSVILSNHVGTSAPLAFELYGPKMLRHWGAHEMNSGLINYTNIKQRFIITKRNTGIYLQLECFA